MQSYTRYSYADLYEHLQNKFGNRPAKASDKNIALYIKRYKVRSRILAFCVTEIASYITTMWYTFVIFCYFHAQHSTINRFKRWLMLNGEDLWLHFYCFDKKQWFFTISIERKWYLRELWSVENRNRTRRPKMFLQDTIQNSRYGNNIHVFSHFFLATMQINIQGFFVIFFPCQLK